MESTRPTICFFVSDLHGSTTRYEKLFQAILDEKPDIVLMGGDLLPSHGVLSDRHFDDFIADFLLTELNHVRKTLGVRLPQIFLIPGNDDPASEVRKLSDLEEHGLWTYVHNRRVPFEDYVIFGYAFVPPTPFRLKDWEKYDVSRYVDPGCISPAEGAHTVPISDSELKYGTIQKDIERLVQQEELSNAVILFHTPPYQTKLDRAALDGKTVDHVPLDVHVGSIAVRRFIEQRQPLLTLHGHVHESARITGSWRDRIGKTHLFSAAHDGPELSLVRFPLQDLTSATRELL